MKIYRNEQYNFEIEIPEIWSLSDGDEPIWLKTLFMLKMGTMPHVDVTFNCGPEEDFNIVIEEMSPEPTPVDTERIFKAMSHEMGYQNYTFDRIVAGEKQHTCVRYQMAGRVWSKKYLIVLHEIGYALTASCNSLQLFNNRESVWDKIASSLHVYSPQIVSQRAPGQPNPKNMTANECNVYGDQLFHEGRWQEAERFYLAQLEKCKGKDPYFQTRAYFSLGRLRYQQGDIVQALHLHQQAFKSNEQIRDMELFSLIFNGMGEVYRLQSDYSQAIENYNKSLNIALNLNIEEHLAIVYGNLGIVYKNRGELEQAIEAYNSSLFYSIKLGLDRLTANQYGNLGVVYVMQGRLRLAEDTLKRSLDLCLKLNLQEGIANAYSNLGIIYQQLNDYEQATEMFQKSLTMKKAMGDDRGIALSYGNLGVIRDYLGDTEQAMTYYIRAIGIFEQIKDHHNNARFHNNLGLLNYRLGDFDKAKKYLLQARILFEMVGDRQGVYKVTAELRQYRLGA